MRSSRINGEGELRGQPANPGSPGKMSVQTECVYDSGSYCISLFLHNLPVALICSVMVYNGATSYNILSSPKMTFNLMCTSNNNNNNNNNRISIARYGRNFRGAGGRSDQCSVKV